MLLSLLGLSKLSVKWLFRKVDRIQEFMKLVHLMRDQGLASEEPLKQIRAYIEQYEDDPAFAKFMHEPVVDYLNGTASLMGVMVTL